MGLRDHPKSHEREPQYDEASLLEKEGEGGVLAGHRDTVSVKQGEEVKQLKKQVSRTCQSSPSTTHEPRATVLYLAAMEHPLRNF